MHGVDEPVEQPAKDLLLLKREAELDQDIAHVADLAREAGAYFRQLRAEGFKRREAMDLVMLHLSGGAMLEMPEV